MKSYNSNCNDTYHLRTFISTILSIRRSRFESTQRSGYFIMADVEKYNAGERKRKTNSMQHFRLAISLKSLTQISNFFILDFWRIFELCFSDQNHTKPNRITITIVYLAIEVSDTKKDCE